MAVKHHIATAGISGTAVAALMVMTQACNQVLAMFNTP